MATSKQMKSQPKSGHIMHESGPITVPSPSLRLNLSLNSSNDPIPNLKIVKADQYNQKYPQSQKNTSIPNQKTPASSYPNTNIKQIPKQVETSQNINSKTGTGIKPQSNQVSNPASNQVSKPASNQVSNQVSNPASNQVSKPASNQVSNPASKPASNQVSKPASRPTSKPNEEKYNTIQHRINFVKDILQDNELKPIINLDNTETENFICPSKYNISPNSKGSMIYESYDGSNDESSYDIRSILDKRIFDFYEVINDTGGKLKYIKSGSTGHTFKGTVSNNDSTSKNYAVKVVAYPIKEHYGDMNDTRRPENAELMMIRLLSYFVVKKQTPHIVLPIGTFYTKITPFINLIEGEYVDKENKRYQEFIDRYAKNEYYDTVSILISEWANKGDFLEFIKKNYKEFTLMHWKVFFFQIISALAVIQSKFNGFRHNDLKANNILVHKIGYACKKFSYTVCKQKYKVPNIGYIIKLWDFDFACIPGIIENAKVSAKWTDEINVKPVQNRYYDIHYFFNTVIKRGFFPELLEDPSIPVEIKDFVNRIVPKQFQEGKYVTKRGRILINKEYTIPEEILRTDPLFEEFKA